MSEDRPALRISLLFIIYLLPFFTQTTSHMQRLPVGDASNPHFNPRSYPAQRSAVPFGWSSWTRCSRTCGSGVSSRSRLCKPNYNAPAPFYQCSKDSKQFKVCNTQLCPDSEPDFRQFQCSAYNNRDIGGEITTKWVPVKGHFDCELKCKSVNHRRIYTFGKALDGTKCHSEQDRVCIDGRCLPVGCDFLVGSIRIFDSCGVCGGKNDSCTFISDEFRGQRRRNGNGYQEVVFIPAGASRIRVEDRSGNNHLALMDSRRRYVVNGDRTLGWPGRYEVAGTVVNYSRIGNQESFTIDGPTTEDLHIMVLMYEKNPGIRYIYWANKNIIKRRRNRPSKNRDDNRIPRERPSRPDQHQHNRRSDPEDNLVPTGTTGDDSRQRNRHNGTYWRYDISRNDIPTGANQTSSTEPSVYPADQVTPKRKNKNKGVAPNDTRYKGHETKNVNASSCLPCQRVNSRLRHFCHSDFVIRALVLDGYPVGQEVRYALEIVESYKNNLGIVSREFLWTNDPCRCPKLRRGTEYILMGKSDANFRRNEVRLLLERSSYVRKFNEKRQAEMRKLRQMRHERCRRVRRKN